VLATLSIPDTCLSTLCWGGAYKLIAGCSKGKEIVIIHKDICICLTYGFLGYVSLWNVEWAIRNRAGTNKVSEAEGKTG
jgi:hypothetical protein